MSSGIYIAGVLIETIYGAKGTHTAAATGIKSANTDINALIMALADGQALGRNVGVETNNADLSSFFGVPLNTLPINGASYSAGAVTSSSSVTASLQFQIATSGWAVVQIEKGISTTLASGSVPTGAVSCQYTDTWQNASGDTGAGTVTNQMSTYTTITGTNQLIAVALSVAGGGGTKQSTHTEVISMKNSAGSVISTTTITFVVQVTGE